MIPIISLQAIISSVLCFFLFAKLYFAYKKAEQKNKLIRKFSVLYLLLGIAFSLVAAAFSGYFAKYINLDIYLMSLSNVFLYMSSMVFIVIPLELWKMHRTRNIFIILHISGATVTLFLHVLFSEPAVVYTIGRFYYSLVIQNTNGNILMGVIVGISTLLSAISFIINGLTLSLDIYARIRSLLIGGGAMFLLAATIIYYITLNLMFNIYTIIVVHALVLLGLLIMFIGVLVKKRAIL